MNQLRSEPPPFIEPVVTVAVGDAPRQKIPQACARQSRCPPCATRRGTASRRRRAASPARPSERARAGAAPPSPGPTRAAAGRGGSGRSRPSGTCARAGRAARTPRAGLGLVEEPDGRRDARLGVLRREPRGRGVDALGRALLAESLQRHAVEEPVGDRARPRARRSSGASCAGGGELADRRRQLRRRDEDRQVAGEVGMEQVPGGDRVGRVRLELGRRLPRRPPPRPRRPRSGAIPRFSCTAALFGCSPESWVRRGDGAVGPAAERLADPRLERVVPGEELLGVGALPGLVEAQRPRAGRPPRGRPGPRGRARAAARPGAHRRPAAAARRRVVARRGGDRRRRPPRRRERARRRRDPMRVRALTDETVAGNVLSADGVIEHGERRTSIALAPTPYAILWKVMATYRELLAQVKDEIDEVSVARRPRAASTTSDRPLLLDVREQDEWQEGHLPGAVHIPRGNLESRVEALVPDKSREIVVYCAVGSRSAFAAKSLAELGYDERRLDGRRLHRLEAQRLRRSRRRARSPPSSAPATRATSSSPRSARRASRSCSTPACS